MSDDSVKENFLESKIDNDGGNGAREGDADNRRYNMRQMNDMTVSRRLARWLTRFTWYCPPHSRGNSSNPRKNDGDISQGEDGIVNEVQMPCLDEGWEYFERVTLPRHHIQQPQQQKRTIHGANINNNRDIHVRAEPGESKPTKLYSVWNTPEKDLGDFGIGVGLYFSTMRLLIIITLIAGLILLPNMIYFASDEYDGNASKVDSLIYSTSAICYDTTWAPCPTCTQDQWNYFSQDTPRLAFASVNNNAHDDVQEQRLAFILVNNCSVNFHHGFLSWVSLIFVSLGLLVMNTLYRKRHEENFDESQQTSSDYTIQITNPPSDAIDPEEWKSFFHSVSGGDNVVGVTVTLDNQELERALVQRRQYLYDLEIRLPVKLVKRLKIVSNPTPQGLKEAVENAWPLALWEKLYFVCSPKTLHNKIQALDELINTISKKIQKAEEESRSFTDYTGKHSAAHADELTNTLMEKKRQDEKRSSSFSYYNASSVFITFDTEKAQRRALKELINFSSPDLLFRRTHQLHVREPKEPGSLRWLDLADPPMQRMKQLAITTSMHITSIIVGCIIVFYCHRNYGASYAALAITCLNSMTPYLCGYLVYYESHAYEGAVQTSLYVKVTISLWIQTAIVTAIITPFTETISDDEMGIIHTLFAIYAFEIGRGPAMQLIDVYGHMQRHFFAPWAPDQRRMNMLFQGTYWQLAERYTNMTNILFLTFFYSSIFPIGFFLSSLALMIHYWTDKFCLLRNWARVPRLGPDIAHSSGYFFMVAAAFFAVCSSYSFAEFPYDNACHDNDSSDEAYLGDHVAYGLDGRLVKVSVQENDPNYRYCSQDMSRYNPIAFPPLASEQPDGQQWMTSDQERMAELLGYTALGIVVFVSLRLIYHVFIVPIMSRFSRSYKPIGDRGILKFTEVKEICGYIPQVKLSCYPFPVILCDLNHIDTNYIGWTSPRHPHEFYTIVNDVPSLRGHSVFTIAKQWISTSPLSSNRPLSSYGSMLSSSPPVEEEQVLNT